MRLRPLSVISIGVGQCEILKWNYVWRKIFPLTSPIRSSRFLFAPAQSLYFSKNPSQTFRCHHFLAIISGPVHLEPHHHLIKWADPGNAAGKFHLPSTGFTPAPAVSSPWGGSFYLLSSSAYYVSWCIAAMGFDRQWFSLVNLDKHSIHAVSSAPYGTDCWGRWNVKASL